MQLGESWLLRLLVAAAEHHLKQRQQQPTAAAAPVQALALALLPCHPDASSQHPALCALASWKA